MEINQPKFTAREQAYFEHVRRSKAQGLTLAAYCQRHGLNATTLYSIRRDLVKQGKLARTMAPRSKTTSAGKFVAVRVAPPVMNDAAPVCRIRHRSGWTVECSQWPQAAWMAALVQGGDDAAA